MPEPTAAQFAVHVFAVFRIAVTGVMADTPQDAVTAALERIGDLHGEFTLPGSGLSADFAEEFSHFLVDQTGDAEYEHSRFFHSLQEPLLEFVRAVIACHGDDLSRMSELRAQAQQILDHTL